MKGYERRQMHVEPPAGGVEPTIPLGDAKLRIAQDIAGVLSLSLVRNDNIRTNLSQLLPKGVSFIKGEESVYERSGKVVVFDPDALRHDPRNAVVLMHEIGHARSIENADADQLISLEDVASQDDAERYFRLELKAWKSAFECMRTLRKEHGIDLFKLFPSADELIDFITEDIGELYPDLKDYGVALDTDALRDELQRDYPQENS